MIKLLADKGHIRRATEQYRYIWSNSVETAIDRYFDEGMSRITSTDSNCIFNSEILKFKPFISSQCRA
ncbi:hypothetical protein [Sphingobacterium paucimobilis]|uniref:hypothetical protein n=1 Tax=Sphingobacterium paucimobilis TaxID=1385985 RepID=UPI001183E4C7|nr:hypothetical protein [Sphingobacterium paucimobilis]